MRILHCLHNYFPARGGSEWLMQNISEKLAERNHSIQVIATNALSVEDYFLPGKGKDLISTPKEIINGVPVQRVTFSRKGARFYNLARGIANRFPVPFGNQLRMLSWGPRSRAYRKSLSQIQDIELLAACPLPTLNVWYAWKAAQKHNLPLLIIPCFHTEDPWTYSNPVYFRMLKSADGIITLTDWERIFLIQNADIPPEKIHTIGVGIDMDGPVAPINIREKYGIKTPEIILFLGQHGPHKGILNLIYAMQFVWKEKKDVSLVIAGNPTAHTQEIEKIIAGCIPEERSKIFLVKGFPEEEKRALLKEADIFVSVSAFESFGIVFLEAWRERTAVIGCRQGGASYLIEEFMNGLKVHYGHITELSGAILAMLADQNWRNKMGESGYRKVKKNFAWEHILTRWENLYHDTIHRHRDST